MDAMQTIILALGQMQLSLLPLMLTYRLTLCIWLPRLSITYL